MRFLLLPLLLLSLTPPALAQMKFVLQYQNQFGAWKRWGEKHNEGDTYRPAKARAKATGKRFRIVDGNDNPIDLMTLTRRPRARSPCFISGRTRAKQS